MAPPRSWPACCTCKFDAKGTYIYEKVLYYESESDMVALFFLRMIITFSGPYTA